MPISQPLKTAAVLVRLTPDEKARLHAMARERNVTLSQAIREGARLYLQDLQRREDHERTAVAA